MTTSAIHPMAPEHLPSFIVAADGSDFLFSFIVFFTVGLIALIGILYLRLHALPEHMAHSGNHSQKQVIGILALLALFTHNHLFWVLALLVAAFRFPDFISPLSSIAKSLATIADRDAPHPAAAGDTLAQAPAPSANEQER